MLKPLARYTWRWTLIIGGLLLILIALLTLIMRLSLPLVGSYKDEIAGRIGDYLQTPVDIGELRLRWNGRNPYLRAEDVVILGEGGDRVSLDELMFDVDLSETLLRRSLIVEELTLSGAELAIVSDGADISIRGIAAPQRKRESDKAAANGSRADGAGAKGSRGQKDGGFNVLAWLFNAGQVGLLDTSLTLVDRRSGHEVKLENLDFRAENNGDDHQLRIETNVPGELGELLSGGVDIRGDILESMQTTGRFYLQVDDFRLGGWLELINTLNLLPFDLRPVSHLDARIGNELWGEWDHGRFLEARSRFVITEFDDTRLEWRVLDRLAGDLFIDYGDKDDIRFSLSELDLGRGSETNRVKNIDIELVQPERPGPITAWQVTAEGEQLSVPLVGGLAAALASVGSEDLARAWQTIAAQGEFLNWRTVLHSPEQGGAPAIDLVGELRNLGWQSLGALPGLHGLDGRIALVDSGGDLALDAEDVTLDWPDALIAPLPLEALALRISMALGDAGQRWLDVDATISDERIRTQSDVRVDLPAGRVPHLAIRSEADVDDMARVRYWIPLRSIPDEAADWLEQAFVSGAARNAVFELEGKVDELGFGESSNARMEARADAVDIDLSPGDGWPIARGLQGEVTLDDLTLKADLDKGWFGDLASVRRLHLEIPRLLSPALVIDAAGDVPDAGPALAFTHEGPLGEFIGAATRDLVASGSADLELALAVPLVRSSTTPLSVDGRVFLDGNSLLHRSTGFEFEHIRGALGFNERGIESPALRASIHERPVRLVIGTIDLDGEPASEFTLNGVLAASDFLAHIDYPLADYFQGASDWQGRLVIPHTSAGGDIRLEAHSDLVGTRVGLPQPLAHGGHEALPVELRAGFDGAGNQHWRVGVPSLGKMQLLIPAARDQGAGLYARFGGGEPEVDDAAAVRLRGHVDDLALDQWIWVVGDLVRRLPESENAGPPMPPIDIDLSVSQLLLGKTSLGRAVAQLAGNEQTLEIALENAHMAGDVSLPTIILSPERRARLRLDALDRHAVLAMLEMTDDLWLPEAAGIAAGDGGVDPRRIPAIEATVKRLTWNDLTLSGAFLRTRPGTQGLIVDAIGVSDPQLALTGTGFWRRLPDNVAEGDRIPQQTQLDLRLASNDIGNLLTRVGYGDVLLGGQGGVEARLTWPEAPQGFALERMSGRLTMDIAGGNLLQVEPGGAKLIGLAALEALPQRFDLDFTDVTSDGLGFSRLWGTANIRRGVAEVPLLEMTGPIGVVDVKGTSDLVAGVFDQEITVLPRVSAALPLIGLITGGATGGIGALVAGGVLKSMGVELDRIGLRRYRVTGPWASPVIRSLSPDSD
ncbi:MAG: hypothetical protein CSB44_05050 [Gammaproteobacteria bacterium]|nr:MAG: hypothetical protein CSB44_05050 [Gammaproteobacteria bacterium]